MKLVRVFAVLALIGCVTTVMAAEGMIAVKSPHDAATTMNRLEQVVKARGMTVFARIDHAAGAVSVGKSLRPTEVLIFGHPKGGSALMECAQSAGIDLPMKALVWQDADGQVWLGYNDPAWITQRHGAASCPAAAKLGMALSGIVGEVARQ